MGLYDYVMSNPYGSTSNNFFYKNSQTGEDFSILNNFQPIAGNDEVWNFQRQELAALQKNVIKNKHAVLNEMIASGEINKGPSDYQAQQNQMMDETIQKIYDSIDQIRYNNTKKGGIAAYESGKSQNQIRNEALYQLRDAMIEVKQKAAIDSPIYDKDLQKIERMIAGIEKNNHATGWSSFIKNINQFQGETLEEIGTAWFNERIPKNLEMRAVSTGKVYYRGGKHGVEGQLIQDILFVNLNAPDILNDKMISFTIGKNKKEQKYEMSLSEFFDFLEKYSGSEQVKLDDAGYDLVLAAAEMGIQAKSGKNQLPWNKNKSNRISIANFGDDDHSPSVKRAFLLLQELKHLCDRVNDKSEQYNLMANYGLATCFAKFLHMDDLSNQYLLTRDGFISYYDRIMNLHNQYGSIFTISGNDGITLDDNTVSTLHNVSFYIPH